MARGCRPGEVSMIAECPEDGAPEAGCFLICQERLRHDRGFLGRFGVGSRSRAPPASPSTIALHFDPFPPYRGVRAKICWRAFENDAAVTHDIDAFGDVERDR